MIPTINSNVIPLPPGAPGYGPAAEILDIRNRERLKKIHRLYEILRESSFEYKDPILYPVHQFPNEKAEFEKVFQYLSALLFCNELPKLISPRQSLIIFPRDRLVANDQQVFSHAWSAWWSVILKYRKSRTPWNDYFQACSHPIAYMADDDPSIFYKDKKIQGRPFYLSSIRSDQLYRSWSANFMRASAQEKKYIENFFREIGEVGKKVMLCRFDISMRRETIGQLKPGWELDLRRKIRQIAERTRYEYKKLAGYLHFMPSSNFMLPCRIHSHSHLVMAFSLKKGDHRRLSEEISTSRSIMADDPIMRCRPTCMEEGGHKAVGCGVIDLSSVSSLQIINDLADYMTLERKFLLPVSRKPDRSSLQVAKRIQIHSFL